MLWSVPIVCFNDTPKLESHYVSSLINKVKRDIRASREAVRRNTHVYICMYSTAQVKEPIFFFISRTNFTIRDFPPSGLE